MRSCNKFHHFNLLPCKLHLKFIEILLSLLKDFLHLIASHFNMGFYLIFKMEDMINDHLIIKVIQSIFQKFRRFYYILLFTCFIILLAIIQHFIYSSTSFFCHLVEYHIGFPIFRRLD